MNFGLVISELDDAVIVPFDRDTNHDFTAFPGLASILRKEIDVLLDLSLPGLDKRRAELHLALYFTFPARGDRLLGNFARTRLHNHESRLEIQIELGGARRDGFTLRILRVLRERALNPPDLFPTLKDLELEIQNGLAVHCRDNFQLR